MRIATTHPLLVCLALMGACGHVAAAESRQLPQEAPAHPADNNTNPAECPDEPNIDTSAPASPAPRVPKTTIRGRAAAPARSGDSRAMPSRFHSFLPGMFR